MSLHGACLCGRVKITIARPPECVNICNCRLCRSVGAAWGYLDASEVSVSGTTQSYRREDLDDTWVQIHSCPTCSATTHYTATEAHPSSRVGINSRLFEQDDLDGIPVTWLDGRAVESEDDTFVTTGTGHIGDGKAF